MNINQLKEHSKQLFNDQYNQSKWVQAVLMVRTTKKGWLLDKKVSKREH